MDHVGVAGRLALKALGLAVVLPGSPLNAQEPASEEALIDRVRQVQGQLAPGAAPAPQGPATREQGLIEQIEAIRREAESEAAAGERPALGEDEVRSLLRDGLGVDVLSIEAVQSEGRPAYAVTVMHPPGNDNAAFMVTTLLVDGATGGLLERVPQRPRVGAPESAEFAGQADPGSSGLEMRRRTFR